jgi:23S rRNA (cytidine1920-2'-O)/16S rRNA (cytidine1409-2'-O)-methyltransferase
MRADELVVHQGLLESRAQARVFILAGKVLTPDNRVEKAAQKILTTTPLRLAETPRFVSRGGEKLQGFLDRFELPITGRIALDVGASTGGFTDCLLQNGAAHVTCVDVGRAQLHHKIKEDSRIKNFEGLNARELDKTELPYFVYDIIVIDVSFISLDKILPAVWNRIAPDGYCVALVKPQFEATKAEATRGRGVIKDPKIHARVLENIRAIALGLNGAELLGEMTSPITGAEGNVEFLLGLHRKSCNLI